MVCAAEFCGVPYPPPRQESRIQTIRKSDSAKRKQNHISFQLSAFCFCFCFQIALRRPLEHNFRMLAKVCSAALNGIEAYPVEVEVNAGWGDTCPSPWACWPPANSWKPINSTISSSWVNWR
jgi:hypothetical protein